VLGGVFAPGAVGEVVAPEHLLQGIELEHEAQARRQDVGPRERGDPVGRFRVHADHATSGVVEIGPRVAVVGSSGAGKSTLASRLAVQLDAPHVELDAFQHGPDWEQATPEQLRARTAVAIADGRWVCDGNYETVRDLVWGRADTLVWLDYDRPLVMARVIRRSVRRAITRQPLWNGNRERWQRWADPDHPIRWAWSTHATRRAELADAIARPVHAHLQVLRFRRPRDAERLVADA
jgi:adenylate kinase family enzyme